MTTAKYASRLLARIDPERRASKKPRTAPVLPPPGAFNPTHRHKKGGLYRVLGHGILEADRSDVTIYDDAGGTIWVRSTTEFNDGRFARLPDHAR